MSLRLGHAVPDQTVDLAGPQWQASFTIDAALADVEAEMQDPTAHIRSWSPEQVIHWMHAYGVDTSIITSVEGQDVSGAVLLDLEFEHLREFDINTFGKRFELWNAICSLRNGGSRMSPRSTPFQEISRPCTTAARLSPNKQLLGPREHDSGAESPVVMRKRRARKAAKGLDVVTPVESVSIVAIEQLIPKPHKCAKGERCSKWRKQQRALQQLNDQNATGRFPISPAKGGRIVISGDPGNARTANKLVLDIDKHVEESSRPQSEAVPSVIASSYLLSPRQLPDIGLHADVLNHIQNRDPQDNVRQFLNFQHLTMSNTENPPSPPAELVKAGQIQRSESVPLFPAQHHQAFPSLQPLAKGLFSPPASSLKDLPKLEIPRSPAATPNLSQHASPSGDATACRSATASPGTAFYSLGAPASEMDVPVCTTASMPLGRDASQSVPPDMQFRRPVMLSRSHSARNLDWRRPLMTMDLPAVKENEVLSAALSDKRPYSAGQRSKSYDNSSSTSSPKKQQTIRDPAHFTPMTKEFGYGTECTQAGWMKRRKTKLLRHEWQDSHCRLRGTQLAMHESARLSSTVKDTIDVEDYAVACSSVASTSKLNAAMKAFHIKNTSNNAKVDATSFAFQLIPSKDGGRKLAANGKTHHFAVKSKDERIDWMRELMLAKALQEKGKGYDVERVQF